MTLSLVPSAKTMRYGRSIGSEAAAGSWGSSSKMTGQKRTATTGCTTYILLWLSAKGDALEVLLIEDYYLCIGISL